MQNPIALPKGAGIFSILAAIFGALNTASVLTIVGPTVAAVITVVSVIIAAFSHSLLGNGGQTP